MGVSGSRTLWLTLAGALAAAAVFLVLWIRERDDSALDALAPAVSQKAADIGGGTQVVAASPAVSARVERSPLADTLNAPATTGDDDVKAVRAIFENYLTALREVPSGSNAEIVRALSGKNALAHAPLPADSRAINAAGELCDRWGRPYFFHNETRTRVTIRSRGPDGELFTADDLVSASGPP
ncbi:hypothetical protein [Nibricoccus sp. IMCC34717]|uniref:hypothetical protein n=1 Tax=Nibricoccus sp. IMCC34717 TaxID=3034021 RepID=UPI00384F6D5A